MQRKRLSLVILLGFIMCFVFTSKQVSAKEMPFSVSTQQSKNQRDKTKSYYDLRVKPGTVEHLEVDIQNKTDQKMTVSILANTAITNNNGIIDYSKTSPKLEKSLSIPFSSLVDDIPDVELGANESKTVKIPVKVPDKPFDGIVLGGLHFFEKNNRDTKEEVTGIQAKNNFSYVIGVRLSENDKQVPVQLNLLSVQASQRNYKNIIAAKLQNPEPRILSHLEIQSEVYMAKGKKEPIYTHQTKDMSMAPYSSFEYEIPLDSERFKAGDYLLHLVAKTNNREFEFQEPFTITKEEASRLNSTMVGGKSKPTHTLLIIGVIVVACILVVLFIVVKNRKTNHPVAKTDREKRMLANKKGQANKSVFSVFKLTKNTKSLKSSRHERLGDKNKK